MNSQKDRNPLRILSAVDLHNINDEVTNHPSMIRDHQVLKSAVRRPYIILFGQEQFPTLVDKAAATLYSLAAHHIFVDGNKRTAIRATELFLEANGLQTAWDDTEIQEFVLNIAKGNIEIEEVMTWLKQRVKEQSNEE